MSTLKEGQAHTGHETLGQVLSFSPPFAPRCCCPSEWLERGNVFSLWYLGSNKELPDSEFGRGDRTGAQEKLGSHIPHVWDQSPCV